jgi:spore coat protein U-like protein
MKKLLIQQSVVAVALLASFSSSAFASSATSNFDVSIQVMATCSISASNMAFSSITTGTTTNTDASSALTVNCSSGTPYTISLGNGANYSNIRRLAWGGSYIDYVLYSDSSRSTEWSQSSTKTGTGSGSDQSLTVFGRIPSGQNITNTGDYGDTVIATVTY